jgi:hypothetical protein
MLPLEQTMASEQSGVCQSGGGWTYRCSLIFQWPLPVLALSLSRGSNGKRSADLHGSPHKLIDKYYDPKIGQRNI